MIGNHWSFLLGCVLCGTDEIFRASAYFFTRIFTGYFSIHKYLIFRPPPPPPRPLKKAVRTVFLGLTERRKILRDPKLIPALPTGFLPPCWSSSEGHENHQSYSSAISTSLKTHDRKTEYFKALTSNSHSSAMADHMTQTGHRIKWDHFDILATRQSHIHWKIKEALLSREKVLLY